MEVLKLERTEQTPEVIFDKEAGKFILNGRSIPLNPKRFYMPLLEWAEEYAADPNDHTLLEVRMDYFNTASTFLITDLLRKFAGIKKNGGEVTIKWYYDEGDEDNVEIAETIEETIGFKFEFEEVEE